MDKFLILQLIMNQRLKQQKQQHITKSENKFTEIKDTKESKSTTEVDQDTLMFLLTQC
jgi:hypothetical protein